jgi:hypothetical protein
LVLLLLLLDSETGLAFSVSCLAFSIVCLEELPELSDTIGCGLDVEDSSSFDSRATTSRASAGADVQTGASPLIYE